MVQAIYVSSASAWLASVLIVTTIAIPYLVRPTKLSRWLGLADAWEGSSLRRMRVHAWLGYGIVALAAVHAAAALTGGSNSRADPVGLWLALLAFASVIALFTLGLQLVQPAAPARPKLRSWHFWIAMFLVAAAVGHTILNSPTLRFLVQ